MMFPGYSELRHHGLDAGRLVGLVARLHHVRGGPDRQAVPADRARQDRLTTGVDIALIATSRLIFAVARDGDLPPIRICSCAAVNWP